MSSQIAFLPLVRLENPLFIDRFVFYSYKNNKREFIPDDAIINWLDNYFLCHKDILGNPLDDVTILQATSEPLTKEKQGSQAWQDIFFCRNSLALTLLANEFDRQSILYSDLFHLYLQNFLPTDNTIVLTQFGGKHLDFKFKTPDLSFGLPPGIHETKQEWFSFKHESSTTLLKALFEAKKLGNAFARRLPLALQTFFNSFHWDNINNNYCVVLLCSAFETVLNLSSKSGGCKKFSTKIDELVGLDVEDRHETYFGPVDKKATKHLTARGLWAKEFYDLRSSIVHGKDVDEERLYYRRSDNHRHFLYTTDIGRIVFLDCVKALLEKEGVYKRSDDDHQISGICYRYIHPKGTSLFWLKHRDVFLRQLEGRDLGKEINELFEE